jgi:hypothetical protein
MLRWKLVRTSANAASNALRFMSVAVRTRQPESELDEMACEERDDVAARKSSPLCIRLAATCQKMQERALRTMEVSEAPPTSLTVQILA